MRAFADQLVGGRMQILTFGLTLRLLLAGAVFLSLPHLSAEEVSDKEIKRAIIKASIESYTGNCPCPYNTAKNGSRCGKRSAYSRAGGASPICFESDITDEMINKFKTENNEY